MSEETVLQLLTLLVEALIKFLAFILKLLQTT